MADSVSLCVTAGYNISPFFGEIADVSMNTHGETFHRLRGCYLLADKGLRNDYKNQHASHFGNNMGLGNTGLFRPEEIFTAAILEFYVVGDNSRLPPTDFGFRISDLRLG